MASGLPLLLSHHVGCASTLLKEDVNGYSFSPFNQENLIDTLLKTERISEAKRLSMGNNSQKMISDFGLDYFCYNVYESIKHLTKKDKRRPNLKNRILIKTWKGRYNPL
jgi:glycogen synthase